MLMIMALLMATMPFAAAQETDSQFYVMKLRLRQLGQGISDIVYKITKTLTFDSSAKLDIIANRGEELANRQSEWMHEETLAMTAAPEKREQALAIVRSEHASLLEDYQNSVEELRLIIQDAREKANPDLAARAEASARDFAASTVVAGLAQSQGSVQIRITNQSTANQTGEITADGAMARVDAEGFTSKDVKEETRNGIRYFVVTGEDRQQTSQGTTTKNFEAWVRADNGMITSISTSSSAESGRGSAISSSYASGESSTASSSAEAMTG